MPTTTGARLPSSAKLEPVTNGVPLVRERLVDDDLVNGPRQPPLGQVEQSGGKGVAEVELVALRAGHAVARRPPGRQRRRAARRVGHRHRGALSPRRPSAWAPEPPAVIMLSSGSGPCRTGPDPSWTVTTAAAEPMRRSMDSRATDVPPCASRHRPPSPRVRAGRSSRGRGCCDRGTAWRRGGPSVAAPPSPSRGRTRRVQAEVAASQRCTAREQSLGADRAGLVDHDARPAGRRPGPPTPRAAPRA